MPSASVVKFWSSVQALKMALSSASFNSYKLSHISVTDKHFKLLIESVIEFTQ